MTLCATVALWATMTLCAIVALRATVTRWPAPLSDTGPGVTRRFWFALARVRRVGPRVVRSTTCPTRSGRPGRRFASSARGPCRGWTVAHRGAEAKPGACTAARLGRADASRWWICCLLLAQPLRSVISFTSGMNSAMTMKPTAPPNTMINKGSIKLTKLSVRTDTSSS